MKYFLHKFKGALITALVFVVLLGFIFFRGAETKQSVITPVSSSFLTDKEILSLEIYYPTSWVFLESGPQGWLLIKDEQKYRADQKLVGDLINDIQSTDIIGTLPTDEVDLDQFGLDNAKAEIVLSTGDSDQRFIIGDKIPVGSGTYVYDPDQKTVYVVEKDYLSYYLGLSNKDYRDRVLFDLDSKAINRISIWSGNFSADIFKEDGEWYVEGQDELLVDNNKIDELLWIFSRAKVLEFEDENPVNLNKYGLDEPTTEVRFYEDDRIEGVVFGKRKDEDSYYIKADLDNKVYSIHKSLFKRVPKNIDSIVVK